MNARLLERMSLTLLLVPLAACGGSNTPMETEDPVPTTLTLSQSAVALTFLGQSTRVSATVLDQFGENMVGGVGWTSQDESVATVTDAGVIRAVANGSTTVDATAGSLTESVAVTVEQVASFVAAQSGNDQDGLAGTALDEPVVAVVQDQGGAPVPGVDVTFTPGPNSGSADPASGTSGADGTVTTTWTLDAQFGPQTLLAEIDVDDFAFEAFGGSDTPTPDLLVLDPLQVNRSDPTSLDPVEVEATVRNQGDAAATAFRVQLLVDDVEVGSENVAGLASEAETTVSFDVGPMAAGTRSVEVVVDADAEIVELNELNNDRERAVVVNAQQVVAPGGTVSSLDGEAGDQILFLVDVGGTPDNLTISLSGGSGDVDLWIEGGQRPRNRVDYDDCVSDGPTMEETCQLPESSGPFHIMVFAPQNPPGAPSGFTNSTLTVTVGDPVEGFDLQISIVDGGEASQEQAFLDAAAVWNEVIVGDIPDFDLDGGQLPAGACIDGQPVTEGVIDDVIIYAAIRNIDGAGGTLGRAGPCAIRNGSSLPFVGIMEFDESDLSQLEANGTLQAIILHEMGHVLGIGTIWRTRGLLQAPSTTFSDGSCSVSNPTADTHFTGGLTIQAFDDAGGVGYPDSKVPVANGEFGAGCGSADGHWRESVFDNELMTPFVNSQGGNPLSAVTAQSMADLGYFVDLSKVDPYMLPATPPLIAAPSPGASGGAGLIDLGDDLYRGPIWVEQADGRVVRVVR